jgi:uncharacterized protein
VVHFYLDASALGKRYVTEPGTELVNVLLDTLPPARLLALGQAVGETVAILVRRRNSGALSLDAYQRAMRTLRSELVMAARVRLMPTGQDLIADSLVLIERHSINSTDALVLRSALDVKLTMGESGNDLVLVSSDQRLLRAAAFERLRVFNPESGSVTDLHALVNAP